jgi:hypothetical protein
MLLQIAGIEQNPGPSDPCAVCNLPVTWHTGSVLCNKCHKYCHVRKKNNCSGLQKYSSWNKSYQCSKCNPPMPLKDILTKHIPEPKKEADFKILQFNCNGLSSKLPEILNFMTNENVMIAAIQETKLTDKSRPLVALDYAIVRRDRTHDSGGGLAFLVHTSIQFAEVDTIPLQPHEEVQVIDVVLNNSHLRVKNVYIPPRSCCDPQFEATINHLLNEEKDCLIVGDFNAHDPLWYSAISDERGRNFAQKINQSNFCVANEDQPTRLPCFGQAISPDISLASMSLLTTVEWKAHTKLSSDHVPIIITLPTEKSL